MFFEKRRKCYAILFAYVPWIVLVLAIIAVLASGYVKAPPDMAYIISGLHKKPRILIGKAGIKIPFLERLDKLSLGAIQIDVKTGSAVPTAEYINVKVDSTVSVRVGRDPESIALAAQNFLNVSRDQIAHKINDLLEGNIREIVGQMRLTEMVGDRKLFSEKVQANAVPDLRAYGLELITFNVQNFIDDNDVITNLGIDNVEQIRKGAAIAKSNAQRGPVHHHRRRAALPGLPAGGPGRDSRHRAGLGQPEAAGGGADREPPAGRSEPRRGGRGRPAADG